ncbi:DUF4124 domain-containing protein [Dyella kyungheensis]|jgi:hypothetical protein|uniref:DUF4124 domain-containing protein n=1 Tax=Dyella kyungheensis TaxID=1242174 RepID=A0ABS2JPI2_9GAMM|nr:DUF4124 domain-containing protein [Dyella kyungheensis]MBM7120499.1 DUF4124 domain-containing protein [Dyella kyungheensis]
MRRLLIATALLLAAPLVAAQAYKWTDASGTVHYSDAPPPQGTKYNKVTTSGSVEPLATAAPSSSSDSGDSSSNGNPPPSNQPMADTPENRAKFCVALKANLDALKSSGPVVIGGQNGQQQVLTGDARQQQQSATEAQYKQYCPNG